MSPLPEEQEGYKGGNCCHVPKEESRKGLKTDV